MIEVLCVTTRLCAGGVQTFLMNNIGPLYNRGVRLNFIVQDKEPQKYDSYVRSFGSKIFPVTPLNVSKLKFIRDVRKILKKNPDFKIIHSHQNFSNIYSLLAGWSLPVRISHSHSYYEVNSKKDKLIKGIGKRLLSFLATDFWACSYRSAEWLYGGTKSSRFQVIKNTVDTSRFSFNSQMREEIRTKLNWSDKEIWINIGTLGSAKNHSFIIDLFNKYNKFNPNSRLLICGDGPLRTKLTFQISQLQLGEKIKLLGNINNPEDYLSAADLFVFPSLHEGFPLTCVEAQCSGIPSLVSSAVPNECKINSNFKILSNLEIDEWIEEINVIKRENIDRNLAFKNVIKEGYDINSEADRLASIYKSL